MSEYPFKKIKFNQFYVHVSYVEPGMVHKKRFIKESTASTQHTFNIYLKGTFKVTCGQNSILYTSGNTSLDWPWVYPAGALVVEESLEPGVRICVQPIERISWSKTNIVPSTNQVLHGNLLVVVDNKVRLLNEYTTTGLESFIWNFSIDP